jgi:UDP-2,3-diacylglucosamine pyrophosphatase LpxH
MEKEMAERGAELWIHGHTHFSADHISPCVTRVVCNPGGYAGIEENKNIDPMLVINIL